MYYDRAGRPITMWEWGQLSEDMAYKIIEQTTVGPIWLSTVWIGLDHNYLDTGPPLIFETMGFLAQGSRPDFGADIGQARYATEDEARRGHWGLVELARSRIVGQLPERDDT